MVSCGRSEDLMKPSSARIVMFIALGGAAGILAGCSRSDTQPPAPAAQPAPAAAPVPAPAAPGVSTPAYTRITEVNDAEKGLAEQFVTGMFSRCRSRDFAGFPGDEVTAEIRAYMTPEAQQNQCAAMESGEYGEFQSMQFVSVWQKTDGTRYYRFRATFSKPGPGRYEVRVAVNSSGKIAGIVTPPWSDNFDPGAR
jgi:hypothetical protein